MNGHLLSDLKGTPQAPTTNAQYPVPDNLYYYWSGNTTTLPLVFCEGSNTPLSSGPCHHSCRVGPSTDGTNQVPVCISNGDLVPLDRSTYVGFNQFRLETNNGWTMTGYANHDCSGDPIASVGPADLNTCKSLGSWVYGLKFTPLFNADY